MSQKCPMKNTIYYLPGMGGHLGSGLGQGLLSRGYHVTGRETTGEFRDLKFQSQIDAIAEDLRANFWYEDSKVIANSFGAYLFLHAQSQLEPYIGKVMLLSPIVGEFENEGIGRRFIPPRASRLFELARSGSYPAPKNCEIHVGSEDWQSNPTAVTAFGAMLGLDVTVVPNAGHMLGKDYVGNLLDKWLS